MIYLDTRADKILEANDPNMVGLFRIDVNENELIRSVDLTPGQLVCIPADGRRFVIKRVEIAHILTDPPIPKFTLLCKELTP